MQLDERGQEAVDKARPPVAERHRSRRLEAEGHVAERCGDVGVRGWARGPGARRPIAGLAPNELAENRHPGESRGWRQALGDLDLVIDEVSARVPRVAEVVVVGAIGQGAREVVAARSVSRVRNHEERVGRSGRGCRNIRHCR